MELVEKINPADNHRLIVIRFQSMTNGNKFISTFLSISEFYVYFLLELKLFLKYCISCATKIQNKEGWFELKQKRNKAIIVVIIQINSPQYKSSPKNLSQRIQQKCIYSPIAIEAKNEEANTNTTRSKWNRK